MSASLSRVAAIVWLAVSPLPLGASAAAALAPSAVGVSPDGGRILVAGSAGRVLLVTDGAGGVQRRIELPGPASGLALAPGGARLAVTCAAPQSVVCLIDLAAGRITTRVAAGHTAMAPVFSPDGATLWFCNRFNHEVVAVDAASGRPLGRVGVDREPVAAAFSRDGGRLFVVNHLPAVAANAAHVAATVTVIDPAARRPVKTLRLPNGGNLALGIAVSPDGRHAAVTHNLARFFVPTTQLERGWMNTAALTLIDVAQEEIINTVVLDSFERGAANPWAVAWTGDGGRLLVTQAGTHELSIVDFPALRAKLEALPAALPAGRSPDYARAANVRADVPHDLAFLAGLRRRVQLAVKGPRALAVAGDTAWVAGYFSDSLDRIDVTAREPRPVTQSFAAPGPMSEVRRGEMWFNDATLCFQHWQSCASCHSYDARVDGLNWDLLNDGIGNPKNAKSLVWAHRTPPAMSLGVRATAEVAVRAGIRHSLFAVLPAEVPAAMDAFLKALAPEASPQLVNGRPSRAAERGRKVFEDRGVGCAICHPGPLFTDLKSYDVGTNGRHDQPGLRFDTPTLVELWRTAPYLHDGSAATLVEVIDDARRQDKHGNVSQLSDQQVEDLVAYLLSL